MTVIVFLSGVLVGSVGTGIFSGRLTRLFQVEKSVALDLEDVTKNIEKKL
jgi:hypothetical protein